MASVTITITDTADGGITLHSQLDGDGSNSRALRVAEKLLMPLPWAAAIDLGTPERIGECEICGIVDHHLVRGECAQCRARTADFRSGGES